jgi:hypothetical protein
MTPDDVNAAMAANFDLLVVLGGSGAWQFAQTDASSQLVESRRAKGRDHCATGSARDRPAVSGALGASKPACPAVSRAKFGPGDGVSRGSLADNQRRLLEFTPE